MAIIKIRNAAIDLDAAEIPNLPATKITSGTFDNARISLDAAEIPNLDTAKITTGSLADARIPNLNASKITAGTIATARLGSGTASSSTFLRGDNTFAEAGGGAYEKISNTTASGVSEVDFTSIDTSTYRDIMILTSGVQPANNDVDFRLRLITSGGVVTGGNYNYGNISRRQNGTTEVNNSANATFALISNNVAGSEGTHTRNAKVEIFNMASTSQWTITRHHEAGVDGDDFAIGGVGVSAFKNTDAVTGVRFYFSAGNIASGTFTLYGRKV